MLKIFHRIKSALLIPVPESRYFGTNPIDIETNLKLRINSLTYVIRIMLIILIASMVIIAFFVNKAEESLTKQRILLVPAITRQMQFEAESILSDEYIKRASNEVVKLNETWSFDTYKQNIDELCDYYYDSAPCILVRKTIQETNREQYLIEKHVVSTFLIDKNKSEYHYCEKLERPCSLVVGRRKVYFNATDSVVEKEVAYFMVGSAYYPDKNHPTAMRVTRIVINEEPNPKERLQPFLAQALQGDESVLKN